MQRLVAGKNKFRGKTMILNKIFSSHMVFAANKPIRIYGYGKGEAVVTFAGEEKKIISDTDEWLVEFQPMNYGGPYLLKFKSDTYDVILDDIYVGEVYLFSGQSNAELPMRETNIREEEYVDEKRLRLFTVDRLAESNFFKSDNGWTVCNRNEVSNWPALGYLSGNNIIKEKNIAIGIIDCTQGASVIESWVPEATFKNMGINIPIENKMSDHRNTEYSRWNKDAALYKEQFLSVVPFQFSAVVWYQGESDTSDDEALVYDKEVCALIDIWRNDLKNEKLPFVIVQLADYCRPENSSAWASIQEAQERVQTMRKNVKTVISSDVCETDDIHPKTKDKLAERITVALLSFSQEKCENNSRICHE